MKSRHQYINNKIIVYDQHISEILLNVNGFNSLIKRNRLEKLAKNQNPAAFCIHQIQRDFHRLKIKEEKTISVTRSSKTSRSEKFNLSHGKLHYKTDWKQQRSSLYTN